MTPVEFEKHLLDMSEVDFAVYLAEEEERYQIMKGNATKLAKERAKNLGVALEEWERTKGKNGVKK